MAAAVVSPIRVPRELLLSTTLDLLVYHGVNGTSLQMIADVLGVTKAAIYHQFPTKTDLILEVMAPAFEELTRLADTAEAHRTVAARREVTLSGLVDLVIKNRRLAAILHADPVVTELFREQPAMRAVSDRIKHLITGPGHDVETLVGVAVLGGGLMMVGLDPELGQLDDEALRRQLLCTARRTLGMRAPARQRA